MIEADRIEVEEVPCPICESRDYKVMYTKPDIRFRISRLQWSVVRCRQCGAGFTNPRPTPDAMAPFYPSNFYSKKMRDKDSEFNRKRYPIEARYLAGLPKGARVLDVGCATGSFVEYLASECGYEAFGTDMYRADHLDTDESRLRFGPFDEMGYEDASFDAVCSWAVFEHLHDPIAYFHTVSRILKPGGRFVFLVTNQNSLGSRFGYCEDVPRHLIFFTRGSLKLCAKKTGLRLDRVECSNEIYNGYGGKRFFRTRYLLWRAGSWEAYLEERISRFDRRVGKLLGKAARFVWPEWLERRLGLSAIIVVTMTKP